MTITSTRTSPPPSGVARDPATRAVGRGRGRQDVALRGVNVRLPPCRSVVPSVPVTEVIMKFRAVIQLSGKTATGIDVPSVVVAGVEQGKWPPVRVTIGGNTYR